MPLIVTPECSLYAESFGDPADPALLLISGITAQLTAWPEELCNAFVDRGFFVIRFDNRDCGLSTTFPDDANYTLSDMAADGVAVLDFYDVDQAHLYGHSMGGMIAQVFAIEHRERASSLISSASTTGNPAVGAPTTEAIEALMLPEPTTRAEAEANGLVMKRIWGTENTWSEEEWAVHCGDNFDRARPNGGGARQVNAIAAAGNLEPLLATLDIPTLVIHGDADPLIDASGGRRTAEVIPGAEYLEIEAMGHDLPITEWPAIVSAVTAHVVRSVSR